jgi:predicted ribosome quality control (RQC) complex YloA/Tae2 family protein
MMTYDGLVLAAVASELKRAIVPGHIQQNRQHNDSDLTIDVRSKGQSYLLFASINARFSRVHLTASKLRVPQTAPNFCMLLRKHIGGSFITSVEQAGFDRVLKIHTEAPDGGKNTLIIELMGKHSNVILVSDAGRILGAVKHVTAAVSRYRQILPGREYIPPPGGDKANPLTITREDFDSLWGHAVGPDTSAVGPDSPTVGPDLQSGPSDDSSGDVVAGRRAGLPSEPSDDDAKRWLVAAFSGIGPFLAEEILLRAGSPTPEAIWSSLGIIRQIVAEADYAPVLITDERGSSVYAYPIPTSQHEIANQHGRASLNEVLDTLYRDLVKRGSYDSELAALEITIKRSISSRKQTLRQLDEAVADGLKADRYQQYGELILANPQSIPKGEPKAKVIDYYDPEMREIEINLNEKLSPHENAARFFNRARKARDAAALAEDRIKDIRSEADILQAALDRLPKAAAVENIRALRQMLTDRDLLKKEQAPTVAGKKGEPEFGSFKIRRMTSSDGIEILYGENSTSNDFLTTKVAKPNDLWFHARSITGAHVVVRTANRPEAVPQSTIREAALVAAKHCDAKHSSLVPVDYTLRKFVRKPRAAAPGMVTYQKEKTMDVSPGL